MGEGVQVLPFNKCCGLMIHRWPYRHRFWESLLSRQIAATSACVPRTSSACKALSCQGHWSQDHNCSLLHLKLCRSGAFANEVCIFLFSWPLTACVCLCFPTKEAGVACWPQENPSQEVQCGSFNLLQWFLFIALGNWNLIWMGVIWLLLPVSPENSLFSNKILEIQNFWLSHSVSTEMNFAFCHKSNVHFSCLMNLDYMSLMYFPNLISLLVLCLSLTVWSVACYYDTLFCAF